MTRRLNVRQGVSGGLVVSVVMAATTGPEDFLPVLATCIAAVGLVGLLAHQHERRRQGHGD